jgi:hypothetical protein
LAEASSGEFLLRSLGGTDGIVPVVRRLEAKFRKPANGVITSAASVADHALDELRAGLAGKGRGLISVNVELHDDSGAHVLCATVEWFIAASLIGNCFFSRTARRVSFFAQRRDFQHGASLFNNFLTVQSANDVTVPPSNYFTVRVNPVTSQVTIHRP